MIVILKHVYVAFRTVSVVIHNELTNLTDYITLAFCLARPL